MKPTTTKTLEEAKGRDTGRRVRLFNSGQYVGVALPHSERCLEERLFSILHQSTAHDEFGSEVVRHKLPFVNPQWNAFYGEVWTCLAGLLPAVERVLTEAGYEVDTSAVEVKALPERRRMRHRRNETIDEAWLDLVRQYDRGLIRHSPRVDTAWLVLQIARAWPDLSIAVAVSKWEQATELASKLRRRGVDVTLASCRHAPSRHGHVLVATDAFLSRRPAVEERDVLVVLDASQFGINVAYQVETPDRISLPWMSARRTLPRIRGPRDMRRIEFVQNARRARVYGFLRDDLAPAPLTRDYITAVFGFEQLIIPEHGRVFVPPDVVSVKFAGGVRCRKHDTLNVQRQGIWRCETRNRFVRKLCMAIQTRRFDAVREADALAERLADIKRPQIGVLAANLEHACRLGRFMPEAALIARDVSGQHGLAERDRRWIRERYGRDANLFIITSAAIKEARDFDVLIRADGGGLDLRKALNVYENDSLCIIDIQDRHHPLLRQYRNQRMEQYRDATLNIVGEVAANPVSTFLANRGQIHRPRGAGGRRIASTGYSSSRPETIKPSPQEFAAAARQPDVAAHLHPLVFDQVFSRKGLFDCFQDLSRGYGPAPGIDNVTYDDLSPTEVGQIVEHTSEVVRTEHFKPFPPRPVDVPKGNTGEVRTLQLGVIRDRVVGKSLHAVVGPYFERTFLDGSHGFRQKRSTLTMLADLEARMVDTGHHVLAVDDIRKAFDNVDINRCVAAHEQLLEHAAFGACESKELKKFLRLLEIVLRGHDQDQSTGIRQGEPYSPTALNVLLHVELDRPQEESGVKWFRYADNLVYLTASETEGRMALKETTDRLHAIGMQLKGEPGTAVDLAQGATVSLLGVDLQWHEDRMVYHVSERAWDDLRQRLADTWDSPAMHDTGQQVVEGWLATFGWTFPERRQVMAELKACAADNGVRELDPRRLRHLYRQSHAIWRQCRRKAFQRAGIRLQTV